MSGSKNLHSMCVPGQLRVFLDAVQDSIMLAMTAQACAATEQWSQLLPKLLELEHLSHKNLQDFYGMSKLGRKLWVGVGMGIS